MSTYEKSIIKIFILLLVMFFMTKMCRAETEYAPEIHCIMGEARGEGLTGMIAVAEAIRNRGHLKGVYGCLAAFIEPKDTWEQAAKAWKESMKTNLVNGATHWESTDFIVPYWALSMKVTARFGKHVFYKED